MAEQAQPELITLHTNKDGSLSIETDSAEFSIFQSFDDTSTWQYSVNNKKDGNMSMSKPFTTKDAAVTGLLEAFPQLQKHHQQFTNYIQKSA